MATFQKFSCSPNGIRDFSLHCGHVFNLEVDEAAGYVIGQLVSCDYPENRRQDEFGLKRGLTHTGRYAHLCPNCGAESYPAGKRFRGATTKTACEAVCQRAEGGECRCSCGGSRHGILA